MLGCEIIVALRPSSTNRSANSLIAASSLSNTLTATRRRVQTLWAS